MNSIKGDAPSTERTPRRDGEAIELLRKIIEAVDNAPGGRAQLASDSLTCSVARRILAEDESELETERTALMALRDLIWRIDTAKFFLRDATKAKPDQDLAEMVIEILDTSDMDALVRGGPSSDAQSPAVVEG